MNLNVHDGRWKNRFVLSRLYRNRRLRVCLIRRLAEVGWRNEAGMMNETAPSSSGHIFTFVQYSLPPLGTIHGCSLFVTEWLSRRRHVRFSFHILGFESVLCRRTNDSPHTYRFNSAINDSDLNRFFFFFFLRFRRDSVWNVSVRMIDGIPYTNAYTMGHRDFQIARDRRQHLFKTNEQIFPIFIVTLSTSTFGNFHL